MKKLFSIFVMLLLIVSLGNAQQKASVMSFTKTKYDFGNLEQRNGPAKVRFEFINTGSKPVIIANVKSSCGCTTPSWSKQPIPPGKKGFVDAVYDPRNRPGHFSKTVTVYSNASNSPVILNIVGNVLERQNSITEAYPQEIGELKVDKIYLNFGNIYNDQIKTLELNIFNPTDKVLNLSIDQKFKPNYITAVVTPKVLKPQGKGKIKVTYDASKVHDWDYVRGFLYIDINGKRVLNRRIQASAIIKERFTQEQRLNPPKIVFDSKSFDFDTIVQGQKIVHVFTFKNTGTSDLIIRKTRSSCGCTAVSMSPEPVKPGQTGSIKATFNSAHKRYRQIKTITIVTNCPDNQYNKVMLRITGYVIPKKSMNR